MMMYKTQSYWDFGLCPSSGILEIKKYNVSATGSTQLGPIERANFNHLRTETNPVSETLCFLVSRIAGDGQSPRTQ
jgi:hypothetical protein